MAEQFLCTVVFTSGIDSYWWLKVLKKGYRHCFVLYPLRLNGENLTVMLEPSTNYMKTVIFQNTIEEILADYGEITDTIECQVDNICLNKYSIEVRTCVTIIKLILGKRWWWIQTPWRLRNKILKSDLVKR